MDGTSLASNVLLQKEKAYQSEQTSILFRSGDCYYGESRPKRMVEANSAADALFKESHVELDTALAIVANKKAAPQATLPKNSLAALPLLDNQ